MSRLTPRHRDEFELPACIPLRRTPRSTVGRGRPERPPPTVQVFRPPHAGHSASLSLTSHLSLYLFPVHFCKDVRESVPTTSSVWRGGAVLAYLVIGTPRNQTTKDTLNTGVWRSKSCPCVCFGEKQVAGTGISIRT
jgi:hypothetical protein